MKQGIDFVGQILSVYGIDVKATRKYQSLDPSFYIEVPGSPIFTDVSN